MFGFSIAFVYLTASIIVSWKVVWFISVLKGIDTENSKWPTFCVLACCQWSSLADHLRCESCCFCKWSSFLTWTTRVIFFSVLGCGSYLNQGVELSFVWLRYFKNKRTPPPPPKSSCSDFNNVIVCVRELIPLTLEELLLEQIYREFVSFR